MSRVKKVDLYENGTIAIVEAVSPELGNRVQRVRVQLPGTSQVQPRHLQRATQASMQALRCAAWPLVPACRLWVCDSLIPWALCDDARLACCRSCCRSSGRGRWTSQPTHRLRMATPSSSTSSVSMRLCWSVGDHEHAFLHSDIQCVGFDLPHL